MKYNEMTFGQMEAVVNKLGGMDGVRRLLSGELLLQGKEKVYLPWSKVYDLLGMSEEYNSVIASLAITEQEGLWTVPVLKGVTCNKIIAGYKKAGVNVWAYDDDLDKYVTVNDRDPNRDGSYSVSFKTTVEADEENKNQSADQRRAEECKDITLLERLLMGLAYFLVTGKHLDVKNWTLCSGSRGSSDFVPDVGWDSYSRKVFVVWYDSGDRDDGLRARSVVSLPAKPAESVA